jgi:hypothetical protein
MAETTTSLGTDLNSILDTIKGYNSAIKAHLLSPVTDTPILLDLIKQFNIDNIITKSNREAFAGGDLDRGVLVDVIHQYDALMREISMRASAKLEYYSTAAVELDNINSKLDNQRGIFINTIRGSA